MKTKNRALLFLGGIGFVALIGVVFCYIRPEPKISGTPAATPAAQPDALPSLSATKVQPSRQEQENAMTKFLNAMNDSLKKAGNQAAPAIVEQLKQAVASKDHGEIVRAFHEAIYGRLQKMSESIPAVKVYLADADPFVRLTAARTLYTAGDRSGYKTLLELITAKEAILDDRQDLRIEAARILCKFRETEASTATFELYQRTKTMSVLNAAVRLSLGKPSPEVIQALLQQKHTAFGVFNLSLAESPEVVAAAQELFANPKVPSNYQQETKNTAAWALIRAGGNEPYLSYLTQQAAQAIENVTPRGREVDTNQYRKAFKSLASTNNPAVRPFLERALGSPSDEIVQYAVVNLLFNQAEASDKARQVVLRELHGEQKKLGIELTLDIASKLDDPEIRAAGEAFDQRSGNGSWKLYTTERKQWPIYNWIDNYVVVLKK